MKHKNLTPREIIKILQKDGWYPFKQKGSHKTFKHLTKKGKITVSVHKGRTLPSGTLNAILKQAGIKE